MSGGTRLPGPIANGGPPQNNTQRGQEPKVNNEPRGAAPRKSRQHSPPKSKDADADAVQILKSERDANRITGTVDNVAQNNNGDTTPTGNLQKSTSNGALQRGAVEQPPDGSTEQGEDAPKKKRLSAMKPVARYVTVIYVSVVYRINVNSELCMI